MPSHSYVATVTERAESHPDTVALVEAQREITYASLARNLRAEAARLHAQGVAAGETIALDMEGPLETGFARICSFYALGYLGAVALPLPTGLTAAHRDELLAALGARTLGTGPAIGQAPAPRGDEPDRLTPYRFSSGSTGVPKAATSKNALWTLQHAAASRALDFGPGDRLLPAIPLPHPIGLRYLLRIHAAGGALVNATLPQSLEELAELIARFGVTRIAASPAQLRWLASRPAPAGFRLPPLAGIVTGGAPLSPEEQQAVRERLCPHLFIDYGAVEFSMIAVQRPEDAPGSGAGVIEGVEAEVVDDAEQVLPAGQVGQLRVRAPWSPQGYAAGHGSRQFRDGWFYTGDLARFAAPRRIVLAGRADDLINRGGVKIAPQLIEAVLAAHPEVSDVAVAGVPDRIAGELPIAFVVLKRPEALQELNDYCRQRIEAFRLPEGYVAVNQSPRSPEGKVLRAQLRALVKPRS
jgi:long-chain acyl-CoA synthetase